MADKLSASTSKIAKLLRMVLSLEATDGEWQNSFSLLMAVLKEVDPGGHEITRRIEAPITEEEVKERVKAEAQKIFEAGRAKGRAEEIESRNRGVNALAALAPKGSGGGVNGYSWREIVGYCLTYKHRIHDEWEANFIESVAGQMTSPYSSLSEKQKPIVTRIFQRWFSGRI